MAAAVRNSTSLHPRHAGPGKEAAGGLATHHRRRAVSWHRANSSIAKAERAIHVRRLHASPWVISGASRAAHARRGKSGSAWYHTFRAPYAVEYQWKKRKAPVADTGGACRACLAVSQRCSFLPATQTRTKGSTHVKQHRATADDGICTPTSQCGSKTRHCIHRPAHLRWVGYERRRRNKSLCTNDSVRYIVYRSPKSPLGSFYLDLLWKLNSSCPGGWVR